MPSGSEYVPSEMRSSTEDTVSMVDESCEAVGGSSSKGDDAEEVHADSAKGSAKGKSRKRRREPIVEGRRWRRKVAGDRFMFDKQGRGLRGVAPISVRLRCTLEKICKFNKTLEPYQKEAIEGMILKLILEYRPFSMQRELTAALVKAWCHGGKPSEDGDLPNKTKGLPIVVAEVVRLVKEPSCITTANTYVCGSTLQMTVTVEPRP
ncbi:hypothetical protein Cgig2_020777 [Carnegiea gigantea]|uniref:Uncharacterized protein n=1 Tax=Carnegiea gigantea TaxID=171969 RepID=A0A9Q1Q6T7_9CARY|nr:hypothetical protein Cgig2_020777 [Carnegiea gigantea]